MSKAPTGTLSLTVTTQGPHGSSNQRSDQSDPSVYSATNYAFDCERVVTVCTVMCCTQEEAAVFAKKWRDNNGGNVGAIWTGEVKL